MDRQLEHTKAAIYNVMPPRQTGFATTQKDPGAQRRASRQLEWQKNGRG